MIDSLDHKILSLLQQNARITLRDMADQLDTSTTPIFNRIKKMEKEGIIDRYTVIVNPEKLGKKLQAFVQLSLKDHSEKVVSRLLEKITSFDEVMECHYVTGDADFILKVVTDDIQSYNTFITKKLFSVQNIGNIRSNLSLEIKKYTTAIKA